MIPLRVPDWVWMHQFEYEDYKAVDPKITDRIRNGLKRFHPDEETPVVSVMIPVWNEEFNILRTLSSLAEQKTSYKTELVLINNKSTDRTCEILDFLGVAYINEPTQGISFARLKGLESARGRIHLCADGDSTYPPNWIESLAGALDKNPEATVVHGTYAFIPAENISRMSLAIYEMIGRIPVMLRGKERKYLSVYGFNFGFRTEQGKEAGGFDTSRKRWSDGVLAYDLSQKGEIFTVKGPDTRVWTIPRRILADGGLIPGVWLRVKKELGQLGDYFLRRKVER